MAATAVAGLRLPPMASGTHKQTTPIAGAKAALAQTLIVNARVLDGRSDKLADGMSVLVDGDPLADIKLIADPAKNLVLIMKDGKVFKNMLPR